MYPIEVLPEEIRAKSYNDRNIVLDFANALLAIDLLAASNWAVCGWEGQVFVSNELRTLHQIRHETKKHDLPWHFQVQWRMGESWDEYVHRSADESKTAIQQTQELLTQLTDRAAYFKIEALQPHSYLEKINAILVKYFSGNDHLIVKATNETVPLVAATLRKATHSFSAGQLIYIYDGYWGVNERARAIGRFRGKHRWVRGVCPIASLDNFRPKIVYTPEIIEKLNDETIDGFIFPRFFAMPVAREQDEQE